LHSQRHFITYLLHTKLEIMKIQEFETFSRVGSYDVSRMTESKPFCFNGVVRFKKLKVTIEEVEEPIEVYQERLQNLWDESTNYHDYKPLNDAAESIGYKFKNEKGSKNKKNQPNNN